MLRDWREERGQSVEEGSLRGKLADDSICVTVAELSQGCDGCSWAGKGVGRFVRDRLKQKAHRGGEVRRMYYVFRGRVEGG